MIAKNEPQPILPHRTTSNKFTTSSLREGLLTSLESYGRRDAPIGSSFHNKRVFNVAAHKTALSCENEA